MSYLIGFGDQQALDPAIVGFKFVSLAKAWLNGFPVPPAVAVSTAAHEERKKTGRFPAALKEEIRAIDADIDLDRGISVRSSATMEDLGDRSFAGIYESFLNVRGETEAIANIERCWQSAAGDEARAYLAETGSRDALPAMGVVLQRMVQPVAAGVAFSTNPVDPAAGEVVIEAVAGLADSLVSGSVTPTRVFIRRSGAIDVESSPHDDHGSVSLDEDQWRAVAELARASEKASGGAPQDIEWALDEKGALWLLQSRPITTLAPTIPDAPPGSWTRAVAVDLWADRLTPYLADAMIANAPRYDFSRFGKKVGMPVVQPTMAVIDGYLYVNCDSLRATLEALPPKLRIPDLEGFFPPGFDIESVPAPSRWRVTSIVLRSLLLGLLTPQSNFLICEALSRRGLKKLDLRLATIDAKAPETPFEALEISREATETMAVLQERNQWPYLYATVFTFALRWLAVDQFGLEHGEFLELISRQTDNVTQRIELEVRRLAARVRSDPELARLFQKSTVVRPEDLPEDFRSDVYAFLGRYGYRARHRAIHVHRWVEAPEELLGMIKTLAESGGAAADESGSERSPDAALARLSAPKRWALRLIYRRTARFLDLREDLRFFLDKILFSIRRSLLELGRQTELGDRVFFLADRDLERLVSGKLALDQARAVTEERRQHLAQATSPPPFVVGGRPVEEMPTGRGLLRGIGTSPGRIVGRARIVEDPTRSELTEGDILVARNTDPGWTPVLSIVGGVVVEEGGLLNHCSIVARELGIPAVVGVRRAVERIPDEAEIMIDGNLGVVQLLEHNA